MVCGSSVCSVCGATLARGARFCHACGMAAGKRPDAGSAGGAPKKPDWSVQAKLIGAAVLLGVCVVLDISGHISDNRKAQATQRAVHATQTSISATRTAFALLPTPTKVPVLTASSLEFRLVGAQMSAFYTAPFDLKPRTDGRFYLLISVEVYNAGSKDKTLKTDSFWVVVDGKKVKVAGDITPDAAAAALRLAKTALPARFGAPTSSISGLPRGLSEKW